MKAKTKQDHIDRCPAPRPGNSCAHFTHEDQDTIDEMTGHAQNLIKAVHNKDLARAQFHADNAAGCLRALLQSANKQMEGEL